MHCFYINITGFQCFLLCWHGQASLDLYISSHIQSQDDPRCTKNSRPFKDCTLSRDLPKTRLLRPICCTWTLQWTAPNGMDLCCGQLTHSSCTDFTATNRQVHWSWGSHLAKMCRQWLKYVSTCFNMFRLPKIPPQIKQLPYPSIAELPGMVLLQRCPWLRRTGAGTPPRAKGFTTQR